MRLGALAAFGCGLRGPGLQKPRQLQITRITGRSDEPPHPLRPVTHFHYQA